jgi:hypothetical protein
MGSMKCASLISGKDRVVKYVPTRVRTAKLAVFGLVTPIAATNTAHHSAQVCFQKSVTLVLLSTDSPKQARFATEWMF